MLDLFDCGAVLFESDEDEERVCVTCSVTDAGGLDIVQESSGPLTAWCFEETPHRIKIAVDAEGVSGLLEYFHLDRVTQLPAVLRAEYTGYECSLHIREMLKRLEIPYEVHENPIVR